MKKFIIMGWISPGLIGIGAGMLLFPKHLPRVYIFSYTVAVLVYGAVFYYWVYREGVKAKNN